MTQLDLSHAATTAGGPARRSRRPRRLLVGLAALASALALVAAGPTRTAVGDETGKDNDTESKAAVLAEAPAPFTPTSRTSFNNPQLGTQAQEKLNDELDRMIDGTAGGATIRIAAYLFDMPSTANKLIAAHNRGVKVQLLIDDGERSSELAKVRNALGTNRSKPSYVTTCNVGLPPTVTIDHPLEVLPLLQVGDAQLRLDDGFGEPVVPQRLQQLEQPADDRQQQDDLRLAEPVLQRHAGRHEPDAYRTTNSGRYKLYFFPKTSGDPMILEVLRNIDCTGVASGYGSGGRTVIRIAMWGWAPRGRTSHAAQRTSPARLQDRGIAQQGPDQQDGVRRSAQAQSKYGKIRIYDGWYDGNDNGVAGLYIHHKALIISGKWFGHPDTKVVYSGSQNYTDEGLRKNNEVVLRVKNNGVYNAYHANFNYIRDRWTKGRITEVPSFVGEKNVAELRTLGEGLEQEEQIEALIDPRVGWYVPPGQDVDNDR